MSRNSDPIVEKMAQQQIKRRQDGSLLDIKDKLKRIKNLARWIKKGLKAIKEELKPYSPWLRLIRPNIGILSAFGVLVGAAVSHGLIVPFIIHAMLAAFVISSAGIVINDYFDLDSDLINQPQRPLPAGDISERAALSSYIILTCLGLLFSSYVSQPFFIIAFCNIVISFLYSWKLQDRAIIGNLADSFLAAITFLAGGLVASGFADLELPLAILATIALLGNFSREIYKDIEDIKGDRRKNAETLPLIVGRKKSTYLARAGLILALTLAPFPYLLNFFGSFYLLMVLPVILISLYPLFISHQQPRKSQKVLKISMFGFMIIFLLAAVI